MRRTTVKNKRLKKIVSLMVVFTMVFTTAAPIAQAAEKWSGLASGDVLIKDTITKICDGVNEHEVVTNNKSGNDQKIDFITEIKPSDSIKVVAGYGKNNADSWTLKTTSAQAEAYMKDNPGRTVVSGINADFFNIRKSQSVTIKSILNCLNDYRYRQTISIIKLKCIFTRKFFNFA